MHVGALTCEPVLQICDVCGADQSVTVYIVQLEA